MAETFFISDLHLGHKLLATLRGFDNPEEMDRAIFSAWAKVVGQSDIVWVLGDVAFRLQSLHGLMGLPGRKQCILGNHDKFKIGEYARVFSKIRGITYFDRNILSHIPVHPNTFGRGEKPRWKANIHGHIHTVDYGFPYVNVCVEHCPNFAPIPYSELKKRIDKEIQNRKNL